MQQFIKYILVTFLSLLLLSAIYGQTTLQVVTKKIEKEYAFNMSNVLIVHAEKGVIDIQPWESNKIKVEVKIIVKNKDLKTAKKELEYVYWDSYQKLSALYLSNNIMVPNNSTLESIVRIEYHIQLPKEANLIVQNSFGQVKVSDLSFTGKIDIQYCDLILQNISGAVDVKSNIGDLTFSGVKGNLTINSKYSTIQIDNPAGELNLASTYGSIRLNVFQPFTKLTVSAERCDVSILNKKCVEFGLDLEAKYAHIKLNEPCYIQQKSFLNKKTTGSQPNVINSMNYTPGKELPVMQIKSNYGNINLD